MIFQHLAQATALASASVSTNHFKLRPCGIENFWNQAKRHMRRFNGIKADHFYWFLKEAEWRFNGGDHKQLLIQLKHWYKQANF